MQRATYSVLLLVFAIAIAVEGSCPNIVSRQSWGASSAKSVSNLRVNPPPLVVVHHSETPQCATYEKCKNRIKNIQSFHMGPERNWADIGYNFLIGTEGTIFEGRGWGVSGAHHPKFNSKSIGVCLIGNYDTIDPPQVMMDSLEKLLECGLEQKKLSSNFKVIGHRQGRATTCPGDKLYAKVKAFSNWESNPV